MEFNRGENLIVKLSFEFALKIIEYCDKLEVLKKYVISRQLLKAGTSIGANVREAQDADSKADFIHKKKIAAKEAGESDYWLLLCKHSKGYPPCDDLIQDCEVIRKILSKIIATSKRKAAEIKS